MDKGLYYLNSDDDAQYRNYFYILLMNQRNQRLNYVDCYFQKASNRS